MLTYAAFPELNKCRTSDWRGFNDTFSAKYAILCIQKVFRS